MVYEHRQRLWLLYLTAVVVSLLSNYSALAAYEPTLTPLSAPLLEKKIRTIRVLGNKSVPEDAIRAKIPYRIGSIFKPELSSSLVRSLYSMGYFKPSIQILVDDISASEVDITIILEEKALIESIDIEGNKNLTRETIDKEINTSEIRAADADDLDRLIRAIKKMYLAKDYHHVQVTGEIIPTGEGKARIRIIVDEGIRSYVKKVLFKGNTNISSKSLRKLIFTRPEWIFSFFDKSGSYIPELLERDKYVIEHYYKSNGYLRASVYDATVEQDPENQYKYIVTFFITEGCQYTVSKINVPGNELMTEQQLLARIPIKPGSLYSSENIRQTVELLKLIWGEYGYIFADIDFDLQVNEENKTAELTFTSVLGEPVTSHRITISGNKKTREYVVRREISINEGDLLTTRAMEESKANVERLGYFDPQGGVNWKVNRINDNEADLELILKEVRTGRIFFDVKFGGDGADFQSPARSIQFGVSASDVNLLGSGIRFHSSAYASWQDRQIAFGITDPWLFNRPLQGGLDFFHRTSTYTEFRHVQESPKEQLTGGSSSLGFYTSWFGGASCLFALGAESIRYKNRVLGRPPLEERHPEFEEPFQALIDRIFVPGNLLWTTAQIIQDKRNNAVTPTSGYLWSSIFKVGIPVTQGGFGFLKWDADLHWYTPIINDYDLILHLHGHAGIVNEIGNHIIPYRELYHVGGPATVRGFFFGQIGPSLFGDSLGGTKAFWMNSELIFPLTKDFNIVGLVFYDGGASWDTPDAARIEAIRTGLLRNNQFHFRQSVGFGVKMRSPTPISIAVGFKLDHNKRSHEPVSEVHFTTAVDF